MSIAAAGQQLLLQGSRLISFVLTNKLQIGKLKRIHFFLQKCSSGKFYFTYIYLKFTGKVKLNRTCNYGIETLQYSNKHNIRRKFCVFNSPFKNFKNDICFTFSKYSSNNRTKMKELYIFCFYSFLQDNSKITS